MKTLPDITHGSPVPPTFFQDTTDAIRELQGHAIITTLGIATKAGNTLMVPELPPLYYAKTTEHWLNSNYRNYIKVKAVDNAGTMYGNEYYVLVQYPADWSINTARVLKSGTLVLLAPVPEVTFSPEGGDITCRFAIVSQAPQQIFFGLPKGFGDAGYEVYPCTLDGTQLFDNSIVDSLLNVPVAPDGSGIITYVAGGDGYYYALGQAVEVLVPPITVNPDFSVNATKRTVWVNMLTNTY